MKNTGKKKIYVQEFYKNPNFVTFCDDVIKW